MEWKWLAGDIYDVTWSELPEYHDKRGWLCELYRQDQLLRAARAGYRPAMAYLSVTVPGVIRGPHEHEHQTDLFIFQGRFEVYLWDPRETSLTRRVRQKIITNPSRLTRVFVPPGVVHAYRNIGEGPGTCINLPDRLYRGWDYSEDVDEIRHEDDPDTIYQVW